MPLADLQMLSWLVKSRAFFRNWEDGDSWRWQAWLALWPSDPENRVAERERDTERKSCV